MSLQLAGCVTGGWGEKGWEKESSQSPEPTPKNAQSPSCPVHALLGGVFVRNTKERVEQLHSCIKFIPLLLYIRFTFSQFSCPVLNIAIIPDPERQTTLVCNSEIFQSLSSWMKFPSRTLCARK